MSFKISMIGVLASLWTLAGLAPCAEDTYASWTPEQLKMKILQLEKEVAMLREHPASADPSGSGAALLKEMLVDDFEGEKAKNGESWATACDSSMLGTIVQPLPFVASTGGSPQSPGHSGRIHGHLGAGKAPWPWAFMALNLSDNDLRAYHGISFYVKGNGGPLRVQLLKGAVKDFAHFSVETATTRSWKKVNLAFSDFKQPAWAKAVPAVFDDVEKITFGPSTMDADFDFQIDDLSLNP
jgi:hypothetical protein